MHPDGETLEDRLHEEWNIRREEGQGFPMRILQAPEGGFDRASAEEAIETLSGIFPETSYRIVHRWASEWEVA